MISRWPFGWTMVLGICLATGAALFGVSWKVHGLESVLGLDLGIVAVSLVLLGALLSQLVHFVSTQPADRAVLHLVLRDQVVGCAVKVGRRLVVTSASAVHRALPGRLGGAPLAAPKRGEQVFLRFLSGSDTGRAGVAARIVLWGPARPGLLRCDLAVLRTVGRLPWWIPSLSLLPGSYEGVARVLIPDGRVPPEALEVRMRAHQLVDVDPGLGGSEVSGSPVVVVPQGSGDGGCSALETQIVALLSAQPGAAAEAGAEAVRVQPERGARGGAGTRTRVRETTSVALVEADDLRAVLGDVSRRRFLRAGAGAAVLAAAGGTVAGLSSWLGRMEGAGWGSLFKEGAVRRFLLDRGHDIGSVREESGMTMLGMSQTVLAGLDFVTCPNHSVADEMSEIINARRSHGRRCARYRICADKMVIMTRRDALPVLVASGLLAYPRGLVAGVAPQFDVHNYLANFGSMWGDFDPDFRFAANQIKISYSDPLKAGGGEMLLMLYDFVQRQADASERNGGLRFPDRARQSSWLWSSAGPLWSWGEGSTRDLSAKLMNEHAEMIFTYEHEALSYLLNPPGDASPGEYVILRTFPEARFDQYLLGISDRGHDLGRLFAAMDTSAKEGDAFADLLNQKLYLRAGTHGDTMDQEFDTGKYRRFMPESGARVRTSSLGAGRVDFIGAKAMRDLVEQMRQAVGTR